MIKVLSFFGTSISTISGATMAGEMNLAKLRGLQTPKRETSYRKKINAPMAAYFDPGHASCLRKNLINNKER
jgi:hypothetical protein